MGLRAGVVGVGRDLRVGAVGLRAGVVVVGRDLWVLHRNRIRVRQFGEVASPLEVNRSY